MIPNEMNLLDLLSNNNVTFFIPPCQRNYEWTRGQCQVFFDDILKTYCLNQAGAATNTFLGRLPISAVKQHSGNLLDLY